MISFFQKILICLVLLALAYGGFQLLSSHASAATSVVKSGVSGYCLDVHDDRDASGAVVDSWKCNDSSAQSWKVSGSSVIHNDKFCLAASGNNIFSDSCDQSPGQVWLADKTGLINPNSGLCLALPDGKTGEQLVLASCDHAGSAAESWSYKTSDVTDDAAATCAKVSGEGPRVACVAEQEWAIWQSGTLGHNYLLNRYTNGSSYEEWCADFVSYVYKQAGFPFSGGESDGWDENIAANIQNQGFTLHPAGSYVPQAGDVAFFDYPGGHVEIVISSGPHPTFIYGNSDTIDPTTGNGQMASNTILSDHNGQVEYYLTPIK